MNLLFRLFIFLGSLVVILLFGALIAPYFINWDEFTSDFEKQASLVIGQEVKVGGKTNLRLLPLPFLSFEDLQVGKNIDGSPLMTVDQFSFNAELLPFLSGEVRILEMSMQRPKVNLQVSENGKIAWTNPKEFLVDPEQVNIEKLNIQNGSILVAGLVGNRSLQIENIQGNLNAKSIVGPWRIDADANVEGIESQIKIATGTFQEDGSMRLKMDLNRKDRPYNLLLDGPIKLQDDALSWNGEFRISQFVKSQIEEMDIPIEPLPVFSTGNFEATPKQINIAEYRLEIGSQDDPYTVTGQGSINIRDEIFFKVQADGRQIDVDQLEQNGTSEAEKFTLEKRLSALQDVLKRVPVPTAKGEIDIILPAIVAGDTYIRDVKTLISPTGNGWAVKNLQAILPGNTVFEAKGRLGLKNGFGFSGKVLTASRQPSGLADWISGNVDETFRKLKTLGLSADLTITKRQATLENVELRMDDALLKGKLQRLSGQGGRPALLAELKGNRVNVDDLLALYSLTQTENSLEKPHDINIKVDADVFQAKLGDQPFVAKEMNANIQMRDGVVSVEKLNTSDFLGAKISTYGRIEDVLSKPNGNMKLSLEAENATKLLEFSNRFLDNNSFVEYLSSVADLTKSTALNFELDTTGSEGGARGVLLVGGKAGGSDLSLRFGFDGKIDDVTNLPITVDGTVDNARPSILLQQLGIKTLPSEVYGEISGEMKLAFGLSGVPKDGLDTRISLTGKDMSFAASGTVSSDTLNHYGANLKVTAGVGDFAPYIVLTDLLIPGFSADKKLPLSASFTVDKNKQDFAFSDVKGQVGGNNFSGEIKLQQEQVSRPRVSGRVNLDSIHLPVIAEAVFGRATSLGTSLGITDDIAFDQSSIFGEALYKGIDASLKISSKQLNLGNNFIGQTGSFQLAMIDGAIDFNAITFEILEGKFDGGINLKNTAGSVLANLNYSIVGMNADEFVKSIGGSDFMKGSITLSGSAETSGQSISSLITNLAGNGFVAIKEGEVQGINTKALDSILAETGVDNYEITPEKILTLFTNNALSSSFKIPELDTPFSISRGKIRARNVRYATNDITLSSSMEYNLQAKELDASTVVSFKPEKREQISGADPEAVITWNGPLQNITPKVNVDRLEGYLSLRAFETSQRRLETLEAEVIEKQRLRGQIAYAFAREQYEERLHLEALRIEEERKRREAEEARKREEERLRKEAEAAELKRQQALEEEKRIAEEERIAKLKAELEVREAEALRKFQQQSNPVLRDNTLENVENFLNAN